MKELEQVSERKRTLGLHATLCTLSLAGLLACSRCLRKVWAERVGTETKVACFGKKSEATCLSFGFKNLFVSTGGIEGWAYAVQSALYSS